MKAQKINDDIRIQFNESYDPRLTYEDKLPEGVTEEDIQEQFGKVVWCEFYDCFWNRRVKDLQKTWGSIIGNKNYEPIGSNPTEAVFQGICTRPDEIVLRYRPVRDTSGGKVDVPYCYTAAKNGKTGHISFANLLQSDGTPMGGNISSQNVSIDENHPGRGYYNLPSGRPRITKY